MSNLKLVTLHNNIETPLVAAADFCRSHGCDTSTQQEKGVLKNSCYLHQIACKQVDTCITGGKALILLPSLLWSMCSRPVPFFWLHSSAVAMPWRSCWLSCSARLVKEQVRDISNDRDEQQRAEQAGQQLHKATGGAAE